MRYIIILLVFLVGLTSKAQTTGALKGRIIDIQSQQPLEGATVILEGTTFGSVTDEAGYFILENIPAQSYNVIASYLGYETTSQYNIIVKSVGNIPLLF